MVRECISIPTDPFDKTTPATDYTTEVSWNDISTSCPSECSPARLGSDKTEVLGEVELSTRKSSYVTTLSFETVGSIECEAH